MKALSRPPVTAVLTVQCALDWLLPESAAIRDEVDDALTELALSGRGVAVDRIILHNIPGTSEVSPDLFSRLNEVHADWVYRLSLLGDLVPLAARPRVHRLIIQGGPRSVSPVDGIEAQLKGLWEDPKAVSAALRSVQVGGSTPVTGYDIAWDGPLGDADPSVYL